MKLSRVHYLSKHPRNFTYYIIITIVVIIVFYGLAALGTCVSQQHGSREKSLGPSPT